MYPDTNKTPIQLQTKVTYPAPAQVQSKNVFKFSLAQLFFVWGFFLGVGQGGRGLNWGRVSSPHFPLYSRLISLFKSYVAMSFSHCRQPRRVLLWKAAVLRRNSPRKQQQKYSVRGHIYYNMGVTLYLNVNTINTMQCNHVFMLVPTTF
jgi:hypothetical protein